MTVARQTIEVSRFAGGVAAGCCSWEDSVGQKITHSKFGQGLIMGTTVSGKDQIVTVRFEGGERQLSGSYFGGTFFSTMTLPAQICKKIEASEAQRAKEQLRRDEERAQVEQQHQELEALLSQLWQGVAAPPTPNYDDWLLARIKELQAGDELEPQTINALVARFGPDIQALYYERRAAQSQNRQHLASANQYWNEAGRLARIVAISEPLADDPNNLAVTLLTDKAIAHRALDQQEEAIESGQRAYVLSDADPRPALLLGGIAYQRKDYLAGDRFFARAEELGATGEQVVTQIAESIASLTPQQRRPAINHLTKRIPARAEQVKKRFEKK